MLTPRLCELTGSALVTIAGVSIRLRVRCQDWAKSVRLGSAPCKLKELHPPPPESAAAQFLFMAMSISTSSMAPRFGWLQSPRQSRLTGSEVHVVLKATVLNARLLDRISLLDGVYVHQPAATAAALAEK